MNQKMIRGVVALILILAAGTVGHSLGNTPEIASASSVTIAAPPPGSIRVLYSLDAKQNDQELIALIQAAKTHIYFAIYEFTLKDVADALVAAKKRGVDVRGLVDSGESANSYDRPIIAELQNAGIPIETEHHADGNGIMHIKAMVTDSAYAVGSYNWTGSATNENDEILEIGTDSTLRGTYEALLKRLLEKYAGTAAAGAAAPRSIGTIDYTEAPNHIGETASVHGTLIDTYTASSGTVFLDFCDNYKNCPFSGVIFADNATRFGDLSQYAGKAVTVTGKISAYQGKAEIVLSTPDQLSS